MQLYLNPTLTHILLLLIKTFLNQDLKHTEYPHLKVYINIRFKTNINKSKYIFLNIYKIVNLEGSQGSKLKGRIYDFEECCSVELTRRTVAVMLYPDMNSLNRVDIKVHAIKKRGVSP